MRSWAKVLAMACGLAMLLCAGGAYAASTQYVVTNDDVIGLNTISVFQLDTSTGVLTLVNTIQTNGFGIGGGFFSTRRLAVNSNCVFASNSGTTINGFTTGDIAAFKASSYTLVGNYSDMTLSGLENGIGLVLNPNGQYLYAAYTTSRNIGIWQIASDCSLTLVGKVVQVGQIADIALAQQANGNQFLIATLPYYPAKSDVELFSITAGGAKVVAAPVGKQVADGISAGIDVTRDGNVVIFGDTNNYMDVETWWISTTPGTCTPTTAAPPCLIGHQNFPRLGTGNNSSNLRLSPGASSNPTSGGCLYIANNGDYRISTATFVEGTTPGTVTITKTAGSPFTVPLGAGQIYVTTLQTVDSSPTGDMIAVADYPNYVLTIPVNTNCTLGTGIVTMDTTNGASVLSITTFAQASK